MTTPRAELDISNATTQLEAVATMANRGLGTKVSHNQAVEPDEQYIVCLVRVSEFFTDAERTQLQSAVADLSPKIVSPDDVSLVMEGTVPNNEMSVIDRHWQYYLTGHFRADANPQEAPA